MPEQPDPAGLSRAQKLAAERVFAAAGTTLLEAIDAYCAEAGAGRRRAAAIVDWYVRTQVEIGERGGAGASGVGTIRPCKAAARMRCHRTTEWRRRRWAEEATLALVGAPAPPARRYGPGARIAVVLLYARTQEVVGLAREARAAERVPRPSKAERSRRSRPGPPVGERPPAAPAVLAARAEADRARAGLAITELRARSAEELHQVLGWAPPELSERLLALSGLGAEGARAHAPPVPDDPPPAAGMPTTD